MSASDEERPRDPAAAAEAVAAAAEDAEGPGLSGVERAEAAEAEDLDGLCWLHVLRAVPGNDSLLAARQLSRRLRELVDLVLEERFRARWGVSAVAAPPPAAPAYAAARPIAFVLCHNLQGKESLAALAVRYSTDVTALKRLNNLLSDNALASRTHLYVPVPDAAAAAKGRRVAWCTDEHSRRRLIVIEGERGLPPGLAGGPGSGARLRRAGQPQPYVVEKLAAVLQRALRIDPATAAFYVAEAKCDVRVAIERYEEDRRWERCMRRRGARLRLP